MQALCQRVPECLVHNFFDLALHADMEHSSRALNMTIVYHISKLVDISQQNMIFVDCDKTNKKTWRTD